MTAEETKAWDNLIEAASEARSFGFATVIWTPEELGEASIKRVEDRLVELGWDVISDMGGPDFVGSDDDDEDEDDAEDAEDGE